MSAAGWVETLRRFNERKKAEKEEGMMFCRNATPRKRLVRLL